MKWQWKNEKRVGWTPSEWFDAESAHLGWASFAWFVALHFAMPWWVFGILIGLAFLKEFLVDPLWEKDSLYDGAIDFAFYLGGIPVASLAFYAVPIWMWFWGLFHA
jgi:hypothetical protein